MPIPIPIIFIILRNYNISFVLLTFNNHCTNKGNINEYVQEFLYTYVLVCGVLSHTYKACTHMTSGNHSLYSLMHRHTGYYLPNLYNRHSSFTLNMQLLHGTFTTHSYSNMKYKHGNNRGNNITMMIMMMVFRFVSCALWSCVHITIAVIIFSWEKLITHIQL